MIGRIYSSVIPYYDRLTHNNSYKKRLNRQQYTRLH